MNTRRKDAGIFRSIGHELGAELRLSAHAPQDKNHEAGDIQRQLAAMVFLNQRESKVNAGQHARRGPKFA
jgi:hypothetical protein